MCMCVCVCVCVFCTDKAYEHTMLLHWSSRSNTRQANPTVFVVYELPLCLKEPAEVVASL